MSSSISSLVEMGSKVWIDSIDPDAILRYRKLGATGATSNPVIVSKLIESARFDDKLMDMMDDGKSDEDLAWELTDYLVGMAQSVFLQNWEQTNGDDGYVSFELDPLLEDDQLAPAHAERVKRYVQLGKQWAAGHDNRMIKVPATEAGLEALEPLAAAGVTLNVTLIFTERQYRAARDAIWRGARQRDSLETFKSVYSIFISRIDVYTQKHVPNLSDKAQGQVGLVGAKRLWHENQKFWADKELTLNQEIIFASTGTKLKSDPPDKYVAALVGSDIQTNPPETLAAVERSEKTYPRTVEKMPAQEVLDEIDEKVDIEALESQLMKEGKKKFADPQKALLERIKSKRGELATA